MERSLESNQLEKDAREKSEVFVERPRNKLRTAGRYIVAGVSTLIIGAALGLAAADWYNDMQTQAAKEAGNLIGRGASFTASLAKEVTNAIDELYPKK